MLCLHVSWIRRFGSLSRSAGVWWTPLLCLSDTPVERRTENNDVQLDAKTELLVMEHFDKNAALSNHKQDSWFGLSKNEWLYVPVIQKSEMISMKSSLLMLSVITVEGEESVWDKLLMWKHLGQEREVMCSQKHHMVSWRRVKVKPTNVWDDLGYS